MYGRLYTNYETQIHSVDTFVKPLENSVYSEGGEVIIPASGETAEDISIASVVEKPGIILGGDLNVITSSADIDPVFLALELSYGKPHFDLAKRAQGKSVVHIHNEDIANVFFGHPNIAEQRRIGAFFDRLDSLITLHQRKYDKLCVLKKSMLDKMFPKGGSLYPEIRFAGFTDPWEQRKLGEVANVCSGRDYKHLAEGPIPVYGTGGYMTSVSKALSYDEDAIGIGRKGTIDKPYRLQAPFWTVDTLFYAIPEASSDINFLLCSFLNVDWKSKDESTGLPSLSKRAINETEVLVPDNGEQRRIGAFFDRLDSLITLHQRKLELLRNIKKSMLDKMFV